MPIFRRWMDGLKQVGPVAGGTGSWGAVKNVTISGGVLTLTGAGRYAIETESGVASDDVDTINGLIDGDEVILSAQDGSHTVVLKTGTGNLSIKVDTSLNDTVDRVRLMLDGTTIIEASSRP